jgi:prepilin-type N-terminal cleavage/methylation domain-containing protein
MLSPHPFRPTCERRGLAPPYRRAKPGGSRLVRRGLSLLEVLLAMAIFLLGVTGLSQLIIMSSDRALEVKMQSQAVQMAQAKMAEIVSGVQPLNAQSGMPFDEDPDWTWSMDVTSVQSNGVSGLSQVTVHVSRNKSDGSKLDFTLTQYVMDPTLRGSSLTIAQLPQAGSMTKSSSSSTASSGSGSAAGGAGASGAGGGGGAAKGGGGAPAGGGGAAPKGGAPAGGGKGGKGG